MNVGKKTFNVHSNILLQMLPQDPERNHVKTTAIKLKEGFTLFSYLRKQKKLHHFHTRDYV